MIHLNYTYSLKIFASACLISVALLFYCVLLLYEMEHQPIRPTFLPGLHGPIDSAKSSK